jgi:hypothetical protein
MRAPGRLNLGQRIVIVVGLGVGLAAFGLWVIAQASPDRAFGWVGYAPLQSSAAYRSSLSLAFRGGLPLWVQLLIWLGLTILWTITSAFVLRSSLESLIRSEPSQRPTPGAG